MPKHPLAEVFGFPYDNHTARAQRYRGNRLCPFNNRVPNCTKDKANDPLGVCSVFAVDDTIAITCPIRFRQDWIIADDAAAFFFSPDTSWTALTEVRLNDRNGKSAGNVDVVLVAYDNAGEITDFGTLEVQAVYISGNVRRPFARYMKDPAKNQDMDWSGESNYPRPDYLSSSRKRLVPQLIYKGAILKSWQKKQAVAIHKAFYDTLPDFERVEAETADVAWLVYTLEYDSTQQLYQLVLFDTVYTLFKPALDRIITPEPGSIADFIGVLQSKLDEKLDDNPPDAPTLSDLL